MIKRAALFLLILMHIGPVRAQSVTDSSRIVDTVAIRSANDTVPIRPSIRKAAKKISDTVLKFHTDSLRYSNLKPADLSKLPVSWMDLLKANSNFNFSGKPIHNRSGRYERISYDGLFYLLVALLFYFAIVKMFFGKYLANLLTLFFRASMRQQQLREQVLQSPFPSLLLNILFIITGGLYGSFLLKFYEFGRSDSFWIHFLYCAGLLAVLYLIKFMVIRITGWIFNITKTAETYLFVVFMTNKIIGIFLLPLLVLISFSGAGIIEIWITLSVIVLGIFYIYRFIAGYSALHKEIKISGLHFFLYLCAFEVAPLLLIYKVLITYLEKA